MLAIKASRKSLRLKSVEEDNLLVGMDFQITYLGRREIGLHNASIDNVVDGIYSQYKNNDEINKSANLTITVDNCQLIFRDLVSHRIDFIIPLTSVKSVYGSNKKTKYPNAVILVCSLPSEKSANVHVLHCLNKNLAREFYNAVNRAFDNHGNDTLLMQAESVTKPNNPEEYSETNNMTTTKVEAPLINATCNSKIFSTTTKSTKHNRDSKKGGIGLFKGESIGLLQQDEIPRTVKHEKIITPQEKHVVDAKPRLRGKSSQQIKEVEGISLLDTADSDDGLDDEFLSLAKKRSFSNNIKAKFGL